MNRYHITIAFKAPTYQDDKLQNKVRNKAWVVYCLSMLDAIQLYIIDSYQDNLKQEIEKDFGPFHIIAFSVVEC